MTLKGKAQAASEADGACFLSWRQKRYGEGQRAREVSKGVMRFGDGGGVCTACLKGSTSAGRRAWLAWEARRGDLTSLSAPHSPSLSSCSGACDGPREINASSTACHEIKLVYSDPETRRSWATATAGKIPQ